MSKKRFGSFLFGMFGAASAIGITLMAKKVANEIDEFTDEDIDYSEKAERYFAEKWKNFKEMVDSKNIQIAEITKKTKEDVIKEVDELKRKEIIEKASTQIEKLRAEIKDIMDARQKDLIKISEKVKKTSVFQNASKAIKNVSQNVKQAIDRQLHANEVYSVDEIEVLSNDEEVEISEK